MGCWLVYFHWHWPETSTEMYVNRYLYMGAMSNSERIILETWGSHWGSQFYGLVAISSIICYESFHVAAIYYFEKMHYCFIYLSIHLFMYLFYLFILFVLFIYLSIYLFICFIYLFIYLFMYIWRLPFMHWLTWVCFKIQGFNIRYLYVHVRKGFWIQAAPPLEVGGVFFF